MAIRVAIVGYGNLGRGVEAALRQQPDMSPAGIYTRRDPGSITATMPVYRLAELADRRDGIDVAILCGGSRTDLPEQGPELAELVNTVDSFDTHARIGDYYPRVDTAARAAGTLSLISTGWDPGLFSILRVMAAAILPDGRTHTFWGPGVSQGHSDALRRVPGVVDAVQYTIPVEEALEAVRSGDRRELATREKHVRHCYVVAAADADRDQIRRAIVEMPDYFVDYDTTVEFITAEQLAAAHSGMPHGGLVLRNGTTGGGHDQLLELRLTLGDNAGFTSSVLVAYARAVHRMAARGETGARTVLDVPPGLISPLAPDELRTTML